MKQRNIIISLIIVLIAISSSSSYGNVSQELQWKVNVGDSQRYVVDKYIDHSDSDEDGNIHTQKNEITDINGNTVYVTIQEGTEIEVKIIALSNVATIQITYDDEVTEQAREDANPPNGFIAKTVDDLSYWTAWASNRSGYHVEGDLLVMSSSGSGVMLEMTIKRNWKTGWITYV
ncbi:MAG: hypothetical protein JSV04_06285, partial [Candidatus Heimdallarchaeota archaeon]